jgi:hypothetical protein
VPGLMRHEASAEVTRRVSSFKWMTAQQQAGQWAVGISMLIPSRPWLSTLLVSKGAEVSGAPSRPPCRRVSSCAATGRAPLVRRLWCLHVPGRSARGPCLCVSTVTPARAISARCMPGGKHVTHPRRGVGGWAGSAEIARFTLPAITFQRLDAHG